MLRIEAEFVTFLENLGSQIAKLMSTCTEITSFKYSLWRLALIQRSRVFKIFLHTFLNWHNSENHTDIMLILAHKEKIKRFFYTILKMGCLMRVLAVSLWDKNNYHCISSELNITL